MASKLLKGLTNKKVNMSEKKEILKAYDAFIGDDEEGEPIRDDTPIGQARNYRERIMDLRKISKL